MLSKKQIGASGDSDGTRPRGYLDLYGREPEFAHLSRLETACTSRDAATDRSADWPRAGFAVTETGIRKRGSVRTVDQRRTVGPKSLSPEVNARSDLRRCVGASPQVSTTLQSDKVHDVLVTAVMHRSLAESPDWSDAQTISSPRVGYKLAVAPASGFGNGCFFTVTDWQSSCETRYRRRTRRSAFPGRVVPRLRTSGVAAAAPTTSLRSGCSYECFYAVAICKQADSSTSIRASGYSR